MVRPFSAQMVADPGPDQVSIAPNRTVLDHQFPTLSFYVTTAGLPYFEVLVTVDRELFDPRRAADRVPGRFYSSREDAGLIQVPAGQDGPPALYIVPTAVLAAISALDPRPSRIYYTAIAYAAADGTDPHFAHVPERLPAEAPFVELSADFTTQSVGRGLSLAMGRLRTVGPRGFALQASTSDPPAIGGLPLRPRRPAPVAPVPTATPPETPAQPRLLPNAPAEAPAADAVASPDRRKLNGSGQPHEPTVEASPERQPPPPAPEPYDDGYGELPPEGEYDADGTAGDTWTDVDEPQSSGPDVYGDDDVIVDKPESAQKPAAAPVPTGQVPLDSTAGLSFRPFEAADDGAPRLQLTEGPAAADPGQLPAQVRRQIIERIAGYGTGAPRYDALSLDGEFRGRFGQDHPYYQNAHAGLGYGIVRFGQDSGDLGRLLERMRARDPGQFAATFGPSADDLVEVTTRIGPSSLESPEGRSARVQPVAGADLWEEPWIGRFRQAAAIPAFQAAQNQTASELYLDPLIPYALDLGLNTERALAIAYDRVVDMGLIRGLDFIVGAVGPIRSDDLRAAALAALGMETLVDFQASRKGVEQDGIWGPQTHAAMTGALRALGPNSPISIPTYPDMLDALVRTAGPLPFGPRVAELRADASLSDTPLVS